MPGQRGLAAAGMHPDRNLALLGRGVVDGEPDPVGQARRKKGIERDAALGHAARVGFEIGRRAGGGSRARDRAARRVPCRVLRRVFV
ncbi:hypothetical protein, partial [Burkholderia sp. Tr-860]|uniref:hypothetical protein n=1 Tax=Burkholderia sp. Tr-860 TaxID=2608338 RepID=UPI001F036D2E